MITAALLKIFEFIISSLTFILPDVQALPEGIENAIDFFAPKWSSWNDYVPVDTLLLVFGFAITFEFAILTFHVVDWSYKKIRG